ncbi:MAG TPA: hypothetical protein VL422_02565 [Miltoncostaea sp.]|nr:hypothetical protein [Miltoncostaea sp.]
MARRDPAEPADPARPPPGEGAPRTLLERDDVHELVSELASRPPADGRLGRARTRALAWAERVTTWGPTRPVVEAGWRLYRRDQRVAGSVMGAAIAYRLFIWLLPLALLMVGGLGLYADATGQGSEEAAQGVVTGYVAQSVAEATDALSAWARIAIVVTSSIVLVYESYVLLRTLRAVSSFSWGVPVRTLPHAPVATLAFMALLAAPVVVGIATGPIADLLTQPFGLLLALLALAVMPGFYVLGTLLLFPHGARRWTELVPGALFFYATIAVVHLFTSLVLYPYLARKQETYGVLGVAAGLLFTLFVVGRGFELSASLNALLAEDRRPRRDPDAARRDRAQPQ